MLARGYPDPNKENDFILFLCSVLDLCALLLFLENVIYCDLIFFFCCMLSSTCELIAFLFRRLQRSCIRGTLCSICVATF